LRRAANQFGWIQDQRHGAVFGDNRAGKIRDRRSRSGEFLD